MDILAFRTVRYKTPPPLLSKKTDVSHFLLNDKTRRKLKMKGKKRRGRKKNAIYLLKVVTPGVLAGGLDFRSQQNCPFYPLLLAHPRAAVVLPWRPE